MKAKSKPVERESNSAPIGNGCVCQKERVEEQKELAEAGREIPSEAGAGCQERKKGLGAR